jgi:hypothetical protein
VVEEAVVGSCVQSRALSSKISRTRSTEFVSRALRNIDILLLGVERWVRRADARV